MSFSVYSLVQNFVILHCNNFFSVTLNLCGEYLINTGLVGLMGNGD